MFDMIGTERLVLRPLREEDFPDFCALVMDRERSRLMGTDYIGDETAARELFAGFQAREPGFRAVVERSSGHMIGNVSAGRLPPPVERLPQVQGKRGMNLSYSLARPWRGKGLMSEAASAFIRQLFAEGLDYVAAGYFTVNDASRRLLERLGFARVTTHELERNGELFTAVDNILWRADGQ